jgi:hypothetical protein
LAPQRIDKLANPRRLPVAECQADLGVPATPNSQGAHLVVRNGRARPLVDRDRPTGATGENLDPATHDDGAIRKVAFSLDPQPASVNEGKGREDEGQ